MRYLSITLSGVALVFGMLVLFISFSAANSALSASEPIENSRKQFYMGERVLPDHIAYPALMIMDRTKLEVAPPQNKVLIKADYGQRRFEYSLALLEKEKPSLALTTMTKSQKYLIEAAQDAIAQQSSDAVKLYLHRSLLYYQAQMEQLKSEFDDHDRPVIDALIDQSQHLSTLLLSSLSDPEKANYPSSSPSLEAVTK
jgi:hypothetical protein